MQLKLSDEKRERAACNWFWFYFWRDQRVVWNFEPIALRNNAKPVTFSHPRKKWSEVKKKQSNSVFFSVVSNYVLFVCFFIAYCGLLAYGGKWTCTLRSAHTGGYIFYSGVYEAVTSPFVCRQRTHVAGAVRKLVLTKRIEALEYVVAGTVCKSSAHRMRHWKLRSFCPCASDHRIQNLPGSWNMLRVTDHSRKCECDTRKFSCNMSLLRVLATCPPVFADLQTWHKIT